MNNLFRVAVLTVVASAVPVLAAPVADPSPTAPSLVALAGYAPLSGEGVVVILSDRKVLSFKGKTGTTPGLVHDYDVLTVVNELRSAGAEGISVGGVRLTNQSGIRCVGPQILVGKVPIAIPVRIEAVGNAALLSAHLKIKGGVADGFKVQGPRAQVQSTSKLRLDAAPLPAHLDAARTTD